MKYLMIALLVAATFTSCTQIKKADNSYTLSVTGAEAFEEGARLQFYRYHDFETPDIVDYIKKGTFENGKFQFEGIVDEVHVGYIDVLPKDPEEKYPLCRVGFVIEPGAIRIDIKGRLDYVIKGGKYNDNVVNRWNDDEKHKQATKAFTDYSANHSLREPIHRKKYFELADKAKQIKEDLLLDVLQNSKDPVMKLLIYECANYIGDKRLDRNAIIEQLANEVGMEHRLAKKAMLDVNSRRENAAAQASVGVGSIIKDFEAKNLDGETFHLANVLKKNKYVLVEFWSSYCGPCRAEIPHMKKAYSHFKDKGFEIVSFTLDARRNDWEKASKEENMPWIDVSDLLANTSPVVKMYGVNAIPDNFLVEAATGKIVARRLRGEKLDNKLAELLD